MATTFYKNNEAYRPEGDLAEPGEAGSERRKEVGNRLVAHLGREFRTIGLQIGYRYEGSPIIVADGTPEGPDNPEVYEATARPGSRAPHAWLNDGRSTLDLFGRTFVLLRLGGHAPDASGMEAAARARSVPLETITLTEPAAAKVYDRRLVLVRHDGHVAWRADAAPPDPLAVVDRVRGA
jgi:hypothetical protein